MTPVLELLSTNCRKEELGYYFAGIIQLIERMPEKKKEKYKEQLKKLQDLVADQLTNEVAAVEEEEYEDDDVPLPTCETGMTIEEGDIVTWENYGPNFEEASGMIGDYKNKHFEYKLRMSYGSRMNYSKIPFNTSTNTSWNNRTLGSKAKRFLVLSAKYCGNAFFKAFDVPRRAATCRKPLQMLELTHFLASQTWVSCLARSWQEALFGRARG